jgi:CRISPR/Cas system-associated endoribonuclease Cas2
VLHERRRTWEVVAELARWRVERVQSSVWQGAVLGAGGRCTSAQRKALALAVAQRVRDRHLDWQALTDDEADAICIGVWWHGQGHRQERA